MPSPLRITIATAEQGWLRPWLEAWRGRLQQAGHAVEIVFDVGAIGRGDLLFLLSFWSLVPEAILANHRNNLVVHESPLPQGRGMSPVTWSILEGKNRIPCCLLEATPEVDAGPIYLEDEIVLDGTELIQQIREKQADVTLRLCDRFLDAYPAILATGHDQVGTAKVYPRRTPADSELDIHATIADQFDLLRTVDNESYPAFFHARGCRYTIHIFRDDPNDLP